MREIFNQSFKMGFVPFLVALAAPFLQAQDQDQEEGEAGFADEAGVAFLNVCNATGLGDLLAIRLNGKNPVRSEGFPSGDGTGQIGLSPTTIWIEAAHPQCEEPAKARVTLKNEENLVVLVYHIQELDPETGEILRFLRFQKLPHQPTPGRATVTVFGCDPMRRIGSVSINGQAIPVKPMGLTALPGIELEESYSVAWRDQTVMDAYQISHSQHHYCVVFEDVEAKSVGGFWLLDGRINYNNESEAEARRFVQEQRAAEEAAAALLKERRAEEAVLRERMRAQTQR